MKKVLLLATAALFITGVSFADGGKNKKSCAKGKSCCHKSCCKKGGAEKTTAKM